MITTAYLKQNRAVPSRMAYLKKVIIEDTEGKEIDKNALPPWGKCPPGSVPSTETTTCPTTVSTIIGRGTWFSVLLEGASIAYKPGADVSG